MPWVSKQRNDGHHCVYKQGPDGEATGGALECHPTVEEAEAHMRALYANVEEMKESHSMVDTIREYTVGQFRGDFPQIPIDPRVNAESLTAGDENPFFVTLPIARVGEVSKNGLVYDEELVKAIEAQVVGKGGIMGHLKNEERDTAFPIEDVDWVGVQRVGDTTWGKAYVPPGEAREYIRRLMARGGQLATSIYGPYGQREVQKDGKWRAIDFKLEQLDLAPADRAALKLGGRFAVTAQMDTDNQLEDDMTKEELLAELTATDVPATVREQIIQEWQKKSKTEDRIAELEQQVTERDTRIAELEAQVEEYHATQFSLALDGRIAELVNWQTNTDEAKEAVDAFKRTLKTRILAELGAERKAERVKEIIDQVWTDLEPLAETVRDALAGPPAAVPSKDKQRPKLEDTPEARAAARAKFGF